MRIIMVFLLGMTISAPTWANEERQALEQGFAALALKVHKTAKNEPVPAALLTEFAEYFNQSCLYGAKLREQKMTISPPDEKKGNVAEFIKQVCLCTSNSPSLQQAFVRVSHNLQDVKQRGELMRDFKRETLKVNQACMAKNHGLLAK